MAPRNPDAVANQGEFHASKPRDEPLTTHGHKPGIQVGNDAAPEFSAKTLPPGSAPAANTFRPNPINEIPGQADNPDTLRSHGKESTYTSADSTLGGATSGDVHTGMGKPMQGQTSYEQRHERENPGGHGAGMVGVGASGQPSGMNMADERTQPSQRGMEREYTGNKGGKRDAEGAENLPNESA